MKSLALFNNRNRFFLPSMLGLMALVVSGLTVHGQEHEQSDPASEAATHDMSSMEGMSGMPGMSDGKLDKETIEALKEALRTFRALPDQVISMIMTIMPPNYQSYVSEKSMKGDVGVLILAHGTDPESDQRLIDSVAPIATKYPTAVGFGMAMMMSSHLQTAVDELVAAGAKKIVVVSTTPSQYLSLARQWNYIFGVSDEPAYLAVPQIETEAQLLVGPTLDDHPLLSEIVLDYARELGTDPENEEVFLVGHGPEDDEDYAGDLLNLQGHADYIREHGNFSRARAIDIQDDAPPAVRAANLQKLRAWIENAHQVGKTPLVVMFLYTRGIQDKIIRDLKGLDYQFTYKGLNEHPNFVKWMQEIIDDQLAEN